MKTLFTSDLHLGHRNVIKHDNRPFANVFEMDREIITRWNYKVNPEDEVYVLGDMIWGSDEQVALNYLSQLHGSIYYIKGNHEEWLKHSSCRHQLRWVKDFADIRVTLQTGEQKRVMLSHYYQPFYKNHYHGAVFLHGHSHNSVESVIECQFADWLNKNGFPNQIYNVGCMHWNFEPVTLDEILSAEQ